MFNFLLIKGIVSNVDSSNGHFGDLYLSPSFRPDDGFTGTDDPKTYSYGITKNNTVLSLDKIYRNFMIYFPKKRAIKALL